MRLERQHLGKGKFGDVTWVLAKAALLVPKGKLEGTGSTKGLVVVHVAGLAALAAGIAWLR